MKHDFTPIDKNSTRKVLGLIWDIKIDEIIFDFNDLVAEAFGKITTKRLILVRNYLIHLVCCHQLRYN